MPLTPQGLPYPQPGDPPDVPADIQALAEEADVQLTQAKNPPSCRVFHSVDQPVANETNVTLVFNSERWDTADMHSTVSNTSRITIGTAGLYLMDFHGIFATGDDYLRAFATFLVNGATELDRGEQVWKNANAGIGGGPQPTCTSVWKFAVGDFVEIRVFQHNAALATRDMRTLTTRSPEFSVTWIGTG